VPRAVPRREIRESLADWMIVFGALLLALSLFLTWSHQFTNAFVGEVGADQLHGVPRDPTAWQVYSIADVLHLTVDAAAEFFADDPSVAQRLRPNRHGPA
jgi:hypothetical protein